MRFAVVGLLFVAARVEGQDALGARSHLQDSVARSVAVSAPALTQSFGMMAIGHVTRASPAYLGRTFTEGYLTQPNLMVDMRYGTARRGELQLLGALNAEGFTMRRGSLNAGMYGEGYVDRRHPHTLVHELMLSATTPARGPLRASLAAGKGFTPYGTDDPMMRPFVTYPVNHHHAQIIERVQVIGAVRVSGAARGVALEHARFNGDEPTGPFAGPRWSRVGDSHSTRITAVPLAGVELQASRAYVRSPGIVQGGAFDHTQSSLSLRVQRANSRGERRLLLAEFARTDEGLGDARAFRFESLLLEGAVERRGWRLAARAERTERPEPERLLDPFRTNNGHIDFQIIGVTQWRIGTVHLSGPAFTSRRLGSLELSPFAEVVHAKAIARRLPTVFDPASHFGDAVQVSLNAGIRLHVGRMRDRMGRYGVQSVLVGQHPHH